MRIYYLISPNAANHSAGRFAPPFVR